MEEGVLGILWLIILSVGILVTIVYMRRFTNEERMAMIDKGVNPNDMMIRRNYATFWPLRFALLFIGAGLGLLFGYFLDMTFRMEEVAYFSMLLVFGGLGLVVSYRIEEKRTKEEDARMAG